MELWVWFGDKAEEAAAEMRRVLGTPVVVHGQRVLLAGFTAEDRQRVRMILAKAGLLQWTSYFDV